MAALPLSERLSPKTTIWLTGTISPATAELNGSIRTAPAAAKSVMRIMGKITRGTRHDAKEL
jgi:hypothetical protein